jgi:hypothetical protein
VKSFINTSAENLEDMESDSEVRELESEICSLLQSGEDASRLWQLRTKRDSHILRVLNQALAVFRAHDQKRLVEFGKIQESYLRALKFAITRTDLTVPEMLFLHKMGTEGFEQQDLLAHKEAIEGRLQFGKRRRRVNG